jgi:hypothetical protein
MREKTKMRRCTMRIRRKLLKCTLPRAELREWQRKTANLPKSLLPRPQPLKEQLVIPPNRRNQSKKPLNQRERSDLAGKSLKMKRKRRSLCRLRPRGRIDRLAKWWKRMMRRRKRRRKKSL